MEKTFKLKGCCALCEYVWDKNNCPMYKTYEAAHNIGEYTFDEEMKFRMICEEFEINSKLKQVE